MTVWETVERGEYVMIALVVILVVIVVIWCVRIVMLRHWNSSYPSMMQRVHDHIMEGDIENVAQICSVADTPGSRVIRSGTLQVGKTMAEVKEAMTDMAVIEKGRLGNGARWLQALAVISPLLGLGGTLLGVIDRLRDLGESGEMVDTALLCAQIAPTIVTTVAGLVIGILAIIAGSWLDSYVDVSKRKIDETALEFIHMLNQPS